MHPAVGHLPQAVPPCVDGPRAGPALPRAARPQQGVACNGPPEPVLPLATAPGATGHLVAKPMQALRTFIVEDSPLILDNLIATLEEMAPVRVVGHADDEAGAMARLMALQGEVELVIIDVFLKAGSGLGILRGATRAGLQAKRVVLTNYATPDMREKCRALGADRVFDKSNDLDDLLSYCTRLAEEPGRGEPSRGGPRGDSTPPGALN